MTLVSTIKRCLPDIKLDICDHFNVVPRETPQNLQAHSYVGETFISLSWQHVLLNGTRRGYKLLYQKVSDAGSEIKDSKIEAMMFSEDTTQATVHGLDLYSKYCFQILVFNENFYSKPGNSVCAGKETLYFLFVKIV
jgi:hypothetical protein